MTSFLYVLRCTIWFWFFLTSLRNLRVVVPVDFSFSVCVIILFSKSIISHNIFFSLSQFSFTEYLFTVDKIFSWFLCSELVFLSFDEELVIPFLLNTFNLSFFNLFNDFRLVFLDFRNLFIV